MLTSIRIRNFKRFDDVEIELGKAVVLIGPNNSGKTTVLQALALWEIGLRQWNAKRGGRASPEKRPGVAINRRDLISIPIPDANMLWRDLNVRHGERVGQKIVTQNIRIDVTVKGITDDKAWSSGFEFDYSNEESFVCRPSRQPGLESVPVKSAKFTTVPPECEKVRIAFLPPMSGLAATEPKWEPGRINVLLGEGQTAQVLRNLCYEIYDRDEQKADWNKLVGHIQKYFGAKLLPPRYIRERGEITMAYEERGVEFDLSSSGRGLQQTLLLLAHLYANPQTVLLLDEPDAHLEILRQRETYNLLTQVAEEQGSQIIAASHSEVVLNEAAERDVVIAFVGKPHRIDDRGSRVLKSLRGIGFDQYYQAEQTGWVLYLESSSDFSILRAFAKALGHPAYETLERPFVHYVETNLPQKARDHFNGLKEGKSDLVGIAIFDPLEKELQTGGPLVETMWRRREIENYFCMEDVLLAYARYDLPTDDLFGETESRQREQAMRDAIREVTQALKTLNKPDPWSADIKATDEFLNPLFKKYFEKLNLPLQLRKAEFHILASLTPKEKLDPEVVQKLDAIVAVAGRAKPRSD